MKKVFSRTKKSSMEPNYVDVSEVSFVSTVKEIILAELTWGAKVEIREGYLQFNTLVFGDRDCTEFSGAQHEIDFIIRLCKTYSKGRLASLQNFFFDEMKIPRSAETYHIEETLELFEFYQTKPNYQDLLDMVGAMIPTVTEKSKPKPVSTNMVDMYRSLEDGDAIKSIIAVSILEA